MNAIHAELEATPYGNNYANWTSRFNLTKNPFKDTLDSDLFFRTSQHEEALLKILIAFTDRHALILLTGRSGTGKTMVSQMALRDLPSNQYLPVFLSVFPGMGKTGLLTGILGELDEKSIPRTTGQQLARLQEITLFLYQNGRRLVVIIDEAHFLKPEGLHLLRTLSNLETETEKLVTVLLIGEPSLQRRLAGNPSYDSLRGRITFAIDLKPLAPEDTEQYIKYRFLKCKAPANLLRGSSFALIHQLSKGIPRDINRLLYTSFIESMTSNSIAITQEIIRNAAQKTGLAAGEKK